MEENKITAITKEKTDVLKEAYTKRDASTSIWQRMYVDIHR